MDNFYKKYLKYKSKYLKLKNNSFSLKGGLKEVKFSDLTYGKKCAVIYNGKLHFYGIYKLKLELPGKKPIFKFEISKNFINPEDEEIKNIEDDGKYKFYDMDEYKKLEAANQPALDVSGALTAPRAAEAAEAAPVASAPRSKKKVASYVYDEIPVVREKEKCKEGCLGPKSAMCRNTCDRINKRAPEAAPRATEAALRAPEAALRAPEAAPRATEAAPIKLSSKASLDEMFIEHDKWYQGYSSLTPVGKLNEHIESDKRKNYKFIDSKGILVITDGVLYIQSDKEKKELVGHIKPDLGLCIYEFSEDLVVSGDSYGSIRFWTKYGNPVLVLEQPGRRFEKILALTTSNTTPKKFISKIENGYTVWNYDTLICEEPFVKHNSPRGKELSKYFSKERQPTNTVVTKNIESMRGDPSDSRFSASANEFKPAGASDLQLNARVDPIRAQLRLAPEWSPNARVDPRGGPLGVEQDYCRKGCNGGVTCYNTCNNYRIQHGLLPLYPEQVR